MSTNHTLTAGSLAHRVCVYFGKHRGEVLNDADIALKFDAVRQSVPTLLHSATLAQYLAKRPGSPGTGAIYSAGKKLDEALNVGTESTEATTTAKAQTPPPAPALAPAEKPQPPVASKTSARPTPHKLDLLEIVVRRNVPIPERRHGPAKGASKWDRLLDQLTQPGDSFEIPARMHAAAAKGIQIRNKATGSKYIVRRITTETSGIWLVSLGSNQ